MSTVLNAGDSVVLDPSDKRTMAFDWDLENLSPTGQISTSTFTILAVKQAGGSAELHFLAGAGHGFGVRDSNPRALADWTSVLYDWIDSRGFVARR